MIEHEQSPESFFTRNSGDHTCQHVDPSPTPIHIRVFLTWHVDVQPRLVLAC